MLALADATGYVLATVLASAGPISASSRSARLWICPRLPLKTSVRLRASPRLAAARTSKQAKAQRAPFPPRGGSQRLILLRVIPIFGASILCIRVRKGISRLDAHGAARVHRVGSCVGELAETGAVRAHGEYLAAVRVRAERIAPGA